MKIWKNIVVAMMAGACVASAANYYADASTAETNVFLGQVFNVDVVVKAPGRPDVPELGDLDGFNATVLDDGLGTSETNTWFFRFAFRSTCEGDLKIPPLAFLAEEESILSNPLAIHAVKPVPSDRMKLETTLSKSVVYLGEPVLLSTTWDCTCPLAEIKSVDFHFPVLNDKRFRVFDPYEPGKEKKEETTGLPVHGTRVLASRRNYELEGVRHQTLSFDKILVPGKAGRLIVPPSTLLCAVERKKDVKPGRRARRAAFQYPAYFDNTFFDQNLRDGNYERVYIESLPMELEVKPLPAEGCPNLFNGMVGDYSIAVSAEPTEVRVGDPVTLTITIVAEEYMENIFFPSLRYQPLLINRFGIPEERALPEQSKKSKTYTQTIRPLSTDIDAVPPIELSYFSPMSNAYVTIRSAPVPLRVSPAETIGVFGMEAEGFQSRLRAAEEGIRQNYEKPDMIENRMSPVLGWAHPAIAFPILLVPPLLTGGLALVSLFGEKKHHIRRTAKAARAYKVFRKNTVHIARSRRTKREIYDDLDRVLRAYLGDRLHLASGTLAYRDAESRLVAAGADLKTLEDFKNLFALCEAYRFTSGFDEEADARLIVRNAARIVRAVEKVLK